MERSELIRRLVLNSMCDDFENIDQIIFPSVRRDGAMLGLTVSRSDVVEALTALINDHMARAYLLVPGIGDPFSGELPGMPSVEIIEEDSRTYFYPTKKGMDFHLSDDTWWPVNNETGDDEGAEGETERHTHSDRQTPRGG